MQKLGGSIRAAIVDGNHFNRVFDINPGNSNNPATKMLVTMQRFTIENGLAFDAANPDGPNSSGGGWWSSSDNSRPPLAEPR